MTAAELAQRLKAKRTASGWMARCPAHADHNPSLAITEAEDGKILLRCHSGCGLDAVCAGIGIAKRDLFPPNDSSGKPTLVEAYNYTGADGETLFQVARFEPKTFRLRRPDGRGGWEWNLRGITPVLYRLPQVLKAVSEGRPVFVPEGEKDVGALERAGFVATTNPGGAGKWRDCYTTVLRNADVIVIADRDEPGRKHAQQVAKALYGIAASVKVLELPDRNGRRVKDAADWLAAGGDPAELDELVQVAPLWVPDEGVRDLGEHIASEDAIRAQTIVLPQPRSWIDIRGHDGDIVVGPGRWLTRGSGCFLNAPTGVGK